MKFVQSLIQSFGPRTRATTVLCLATLMALGTSSSAANGPDKDAPIVITVDVAEDLAGKFVPTFVKPDHPQESHGLRACCGRAQDR